MDPAMPPSRATALRPMLLVLAGLVVLAAAGIALREGTVVQPLSSAAPSPAAVPKPAALAAAPIESPTFDVVRITPQGDAVMAGRAAPGSKVIISDDGNKVGEATADQHGDWMFIPSVPLPPGARELTLAERTPNGSEKKADRSVVLVVPQSVGGNAGSGPAAIPPLAVLSGPGAAPLLLTAPGQAPASTTTDRPHLALSAAEYGEHREVRLSGTAPPGAAVRLYVDNRPLGQAIANPAGRWSFASGNIVGPGAHSLRVDQLAPNGTVIFRLDYPLTREQLSSAELTTGHITIVSGQNLWTIARRAYGEGIRYTVIYQANRWDIGDPDLIYPGQIFALPSPTAPPAMPASSSTSR